MAGTGARGRDYVEIGYELASHGFIAVMSDAPVNAFALQVKNARSLHAALIALNRNKKSFLYQQMRTERLALLGHSCGGSHVAHVLAKNPGYVCGVAYAPYLGLGLGYTKPYSPLVKVPILVIGGKGDKISTAKDHVRGFFEELSAVRGHKVLQILDSRCTHYNIAAYVSSQRKIDHRVFKAVHRSVRAWLRTWIENDFAKLNAVAGDSARREALIDQILIQTERPSAWIKEPIRLGSNAAFQLIAEQGVGIWWLSQGVARRPIPTPWGSIELNPKSAIHLFSVPTSASGFTSATVYLPRMASPKKIRVALQVIALGRNGYRLSNLIKVRP